MLVPLGLGLAEQSNLAIFTPWLVKYRIPLTVVPVLPPRRKQIKRRPGESRTEFKDRFRASIRDIIKQSLLIARWRDWQYRNSILDSQVAAVPHVRRICLGEHLEAYDGSGCVVPGQGKRRRDGYDSKAYRYGVDDGRPDLVKRCRVSRSEHRMSLMDIDGLFLFDDAARDECEGKQIVAKVFQFSFPVQLDAAVPMYTFTAPQQIIDNLTSDVSTFVSLGTDQIVTEEDFLMGTPSVGLSVDVKTVPSTPVESPPPSPLVTVADDSSDVSPVGHADALMSLAQPKLLKSILKNSGRSKGNRMTPYSRKSKVAADVPVVHGPLKPRESVLTLFRNALPSELHKLASPGDLETVRDRMLGIVTCDIYDGTTTVDPRVRAKNGNVDSKATQERRKGLQSFGGQGPALKAFHDNIISYLVASRITIDSPMNGCVSDSMSSYGANETCTVVEGISGNVSDPMVRRPSSDGVDESWYVPDGVQAATGTFEPMVLPSVDDIQQEPQQHQDLAMGDTAPDALQYDGDAVPANDNIEDLFGPSSSSDSLDTTVEADEPELQPSLSEQIFGNGEDSDIDDDISAGPSAGVCTRAEEREQLGLEFDQLFEAPDIALHAAPVVEEGGPIDALLSIEHLFGTEDGNGSITTLDDDLFWVNMADDAPNVISGD